ncbi:MAG: PAS domain-containing sensor histidine kinase [Gemmatimonadaceae bacterium]|nr:PAS domain-containing sensor histidine kinase [Gemmatimonadaceae bacterium]
MTSPSPTRSVRPPNLADAVIDVADAIPGLLWVTTAAGAPSYFNAACRQFTGLSARQFAEAGWTALVHPDDVARLDDGWRRATMVPLAFAVDVRCRRHDGAYRWCEKRAQPVTDARGTLTHWVGMLTDVHEKKVHEAELHRVVRHRDESLGTLAHDLRNPLQALHHAQSLVRSERTPNDVRLRMLDLMERQIQLLTRITDGFLDVNTMRWDSVVLIPSNVSLAALIQETVDSVRSIVQQRAQELSVEVVEPESLLTVDAGRIAQALANVLEIAATHSDDGGHIALRAHVESGMAVFTVTDCGRGIEAERLAEIVEGLARSPREVGATSEGLGAALTVSRNLVHLHGGTIGAHSDGAGRGSCFVIRVPLVMAPRS